ncbi:hypothetical protein MKJ04_08510 [Pontibacter sp. E15-1]|uniref:hypothetical protein n=1 Tax=Pontibacter sp. E15-1 TaxID=2919918 RepID=UPI001F4FC37D|nr:hypothetical protein [Pontibacter sp. E15-1]MCJ8164884.1 hypothetical protein [Pontibacter sp. E15-1]
MKDSQIYRVTYEAFSRFSTVLMRCRSFEEIGDALRVNLKYLLNFHVFRVSFNWEDYFIHITVSAAGSSVQVREQHDYLPHEQQLLEKGRPLLWTDLSVLGLPAEFRLAEAEQGQLWGWAFNREKCQILLSVLAGNSKDFSGRDVTFVKLIAENLESKLLELCLFQVLDKKNEVISSINENQQRVIKLRTQQIAEKNERLMEISILNAHQVREPLSRILGLINMIDHGSSPEVIQEKIMPRLRRSSEDLDEALQEVITKATSELIELKA